MGIHPACAPFLAAVAASAIWAAAARAPAEDAAWSVRVNGQAVPKAVLDRRLPLAIAQRKQLDPGFDPVRDKEKVREIEKGLTEEVVRVELIRQYAKERKLPVPEKALDEYMKGADADVRERRGKPLEQFLKDNGEGIEDFRSFHAARMAVEQEIRESVTAEAVKQYCDERKDYLPLRRVSHILIGFKESKRQANKERTRDEARKKAEGLVEKLKAGADFAALAKADSDCPSRESGGDLGFFPRKGHGSMTPEFGIAAYMLTAPGDTTGVVESDFGFHIIRLTEVRSRDDVEAMVQGAIVYEKLQEKVAELRKAAKIELPSGKAND